MTRFEISHQRLCQNIRYMFFGKLVHKDSVIIINPSSFRRWRGENAIIYVRRKIVNVIIVTVAAIE